MSTSATSLPVVARWSTRRVFVPISCSGLMVSGTITLTGRRGTPAPRRAGQACPEKSGAGVPRLPVSKPHLTRGGRAMSKLTRRGFTTTATLAALSASRVWGAGERVRLGFIGLGNRGDQVLDAFLQHKDAEVVAL